METFDFPYHTQSTEYPESGTRVQMGNGYVFSAPPNGPDLRRFTLTFPTMFYYLNDEATSTNTIKNNTNRGALTSPSTPPTGWAFTVSGTNVPTMTVVGKGTEDGLPYIDVQIVASASASNPTATIYPMAFNESAALSTQVWTGSVFAKVISKTVGNITGNLYVQELNAGATSSAQSNTTVSSNVLQTPIRQKRYSHTRTLTNVSGTTAFVRTYLQFTWTAGTPVNFVVRVAGFQLERQSTASSLIRTSTAAVTRTQGTVNVDTNAQYSVGALEAFYNRHKLYKSFIYPHPVYGDVQVQFYKALKLPEGIVGGNGALKDFSVEFVEILQ